MGRPLLEAITCLSMDFPRVRRERSHLVERKSRELQNCCMVHAFGMWMGETSAWSKCRDMSLAVAAEGAL